MEIAIFAARSKSSRQPGIPNASRLLPRNANANANGEPTMMLSFVGSPPARSIARWAKRRPSVTSPAWNLALPAAAESVSVKV